MLFHFKPGHSKKNFVNLKTGHSKFFVDLRTGLSNTEKASQNQNFRVQISDHSHDLNNNTVLFFSMLALLRRASF